MKFECFACGRSTKWNPIKKSGAVPPGFQFRQLNGITETFCSRCGLGIPNDISLFAKGMIKSRHGIEIEHIKPKPVAVCTECKLPSTNITGNNERCPRSVEQKGCPGRIHSAAHEGDWKGCPDCFVTGKIKSDKCNTCDGFGWLYAR